MVRRSCDLCDTVTCESSGDWNKGPYDTDETELRWRTGANYPDGGHGKETTIDICPACFKDKLIPWVESQGGKPTAKDWEW